MGARIDGSAFRQSLAAMAAELDLAATDALEDAVRAAEQHAFATPLFGDQTRRLRSATKGTLDRARLVAKLRNRTRYARFIEEGTRPHEIRARNGKALRFVWNGRVVFRTRVWHPGTKPRPFMRLAGEHGTTVLHQQLEARVSAAIR